MPPTPTSLSSNRQLSRAGSYDVGYSDSGRSRGSQSQRGEKLEPSLYSSHQLSRARSYDVGYSDPGRSRGSQSQRSEKLEQVIKFACTAIVNEMALNCGWHHGKLSDAPSHTQDIWSDKITECTNMACVRFNYCVSS